MEKRARVEWRGYIPAIVTPFAADGAIDTQGLGVMLDWLHAEGMHGLVVAGTTGEWTSLSGDERIALFAAVGAQMRGKLPLLAGCTSFTARETIAFADSAAANGFDGILVTPPPYIRLGEEEIFAFYTAISRETALPMCVYNWPPGTGSDMPVDLLERIADLDDVVAIKQSTGDLRRFVETFFRLGDRIRIFGHSMDEHGLTLLSARGGDGTMGAGGALGRIHADFYNHLWAGDVTAARECGRKDRIALDEWYTRDLVGRFGSGPAILKAAFNLRGLPGGHVRQPLQDISYVNRMKIRDTLVRIGCLASN